MKIFDQFRLALRTLQAGFVAIYVCLVAVSVGCLYFAGAAMYTVWSEKAEPCELEVTSTAYKVLSSETAQELIALPDVLAATNQIDLPVKLTVGNYKAELTLIGIDSAYLTMPYTMGSVFPSSGQMPWLLLSEAALSDFRDPDDTTKRSSDYVPPVDWLEEEFSLLFGDGQLVCRICGVYSADNAAASGYLDIAMAKSILQQQGQNSAYSRAVVKVRNIGVAQYVSKSIEALGYAVSDESESLKTRWSLLYREAGYLAFLGAAFLLVASYRLRVELVHPKRRLSWSAFRWMGMSERKLNNIRVIQDVFLSVAGVTLGIGIGYIVPQLLYVAEITDVVFVLGLSPMAALIYWSVCLVAVFSLSRAARVSM